jgi:hypothetical protein
MAANEVGLFKDKSEVRVKMDFDDLSDEGSRVIARGGGRKYKQFDAQSCRRVPQYGLVRSGGRDQRRNASAVGHRLLQDGKSLGFKLAGQDHDSSNIPSWPRVSRGKSKFNRVATESDNRHNACGGASGP